MERLGLVLGRREAILYRLGGILGASWRSGRRLGNVLGAILASLRNHFGDVWNVWGKILVKRPSHLDFNFGMIFDRFWIVFFGPRERNSIEKTIVFPVPEGFSPFLTRN